MYFPISFCDTLGLLLFKAEMKSSYLVYKKIVCPWDFSYCMFPLKYFLPGHSSPFLTGAYLIAPLSLTSYQSLTLSRFLTGVIRASLTKLAISEPEYLNRFLSTLQSAKLINAFVMHSCLLRSFLLLTLALPICLLCQVVGYRLFFQIYDELLDLRPKVN